MRYLVLRVVSEWRCCATHIWRGEFLRWLSPARKRIQWAGAESAAFWGLLISSVPHVPHVAHGKHLSGKRECGGQNVHRRVSAESGVLVRTDCGIADMGNASAARGRQPN
jgi:hypothetical protein